MSLPPPPRTREQPASIRRERRALSHVGGGTWVAGDPEMCELLVHALEVDDVDKDRLTHGFHSYAARMHWATPARLLEGLSLSQKRVLDPFCGSGTSLIEARV